LHDFDQTSASLVKSVTFSPGYEVKSSASSFLLAPSTKWKTEALHGASAITESNCNLFLEWFTQVRFHDQTGQLNFILLNAVVGFMFSSSYATEMLRNDDVELDPMRILEKIDNFVGSWISNPQEGLLTILFESLLQKDKKTLLPNLRGGTMIGFERAVELDSGGRITLISKCTFDGSNRLLVVALRRKAVQTKIFSRHFRSIVQVSTSNELSIGTMNTSSLWRWISGGLHGDGGAVVLDASILINSKRSLGS
jgi:hypothetical protein